MIPLGPMHMQVQKCNAQAKFAHSVAIQPLASGCHNGHQCSDMKSTEHSIAQSVNDTSDGTPWEQTHACRPKRRFHRCTKQTTPVLMIQSMTKWPSQHTKSQPTQMGTLSPSWGLTGRTVRTNKKRLFSICFQSNCLRNNSTNWLQISHSLLFSKFMGCAVLQSFCKNLFFSICPQCMNSHGSTLLD